MDASEQRDGTVSPVMEAPELDRPDFVAGVDERPQRRREWSGGLRSVALPVLALVAIVGAVWWLQRARDGSGVREQGIGIVALPEQLNTTGRPPAGEIGRAAPDFNLRTLDGGTVRLSDLRGKVVLVNFWASWCGPCRDEAPVLARVHADEQARGLVVLGVDLQEAEGPVREFVEEYGLRFPIAFDRAGDVALAYRADKPPTSVLIDRQGVIRYVKYGPLSAEELRQRLAEVL